MKNQSPYNAKQKEADLRSESEAWDTSKIETALSGDIPILNLQPYFDNPNETTLSELAKQLLYVSTKVGFFYIVGHGISKVLMEQTFTEVKRFHELPLADKLAILMDQPNFPIIQMPY